MTINKLQMEWDHAAYVRKFHQTMAFAKIGNTAPQWMWVAAIDDNYRIYENTRQNPIGQVVAQVCKGMPTNDEDKYPIIQLFYKTILPGAYWSRAGSTIYYLSRRHLKSYKIGLSDETFLVHKMTMDEDFGQRVDRDINLDKPVTEYTPFGVCEVFSRKVVRIKSTLFADGDPIGFMEKGVCVLRHRNFEPLIHPLLGDKWQIES